MLTNEVRREILNRVRSSGFPGGISEAFKAAEQGVDIISQFEQEQSQQQEMQVAQTPQEKETGLREEHAAGNTGASMAFPNSQPNESFNTVGMKAPIDIQKVNDQGHLVESYKNVPPGIQDLPTGPHEGTIIESPAAYQKGGLRKYPKGGFNLRDTGTSFRPLTPIPTISQFATKASKGYTAPETVNKFTPLKHFAEDAGEVYDEFTNPMLLNRRKLKLQAHIKPEKKSVAFNTTYRPTKNTTLKGGVTYTGGNSPQYNASLNFRFQKGGLRNHMMKYLHESGRDTNYVNNVMGAISQHESQDNPTQVQVSGNKKDGFYDGPGRGKYQFEVGPDRGGNTAMNRTANFLKHNTDKNIKNFPALNKIYNADNSLDFTNLNSKDQDALFIGDKIFGGVPRRNSFDAVTRNRTTPPSQEETFKYWLNDHKGKVNGKNISDLTEEEIEVERKKWNSRTKKMFKRGGYASKYIL